MQNADLVRVGAQALADAYGYSTVPPHLTDYARVVVEAVQKFLAFEHDVAEFERDVAEAKKRLIDGRDDG